MLFIKFLYGTRILTILYLSTQKLQLSTFLLWNAIGTLLWLVVMISIGWLAGNSVINIIPYVDKAEYAAAILLLLIILVRFGTQWLSKRITKK